MNKLLLKTEDITAIVPELSQKKILAVDTETTGLDPFVDKVILFQIGDRKDQYLIDTRVVDIEPLRGILESTKIPKVLHNANFDYKFILNNFGICMENMIDTMLIEMVIRNGLKKSGFGLKDLIADYFGETISKEERLSFVNHKGEFTERQLEYAKNDVIYPLRILERQIPIVVREELEFTAKLECQVVASFGDMENNGFLLDKGRWQGLIVEAEVGRDKAKEKLDNIFRKFAPNDLFGFVDINYDSDQKLKDVLKRLLQSETDLSEQEIEEKLPDTSRETIIALDHPVKNLILEYRSHQKVVSTYGDGFLRFIHPKTGRIHCNFRQLGAESGRVSCTKPNLQNIKAGSDFRNSFIAGPDRKMITADYNGCELRIIAEASQDPVFLKTFRKGGDLHSIVASTMFKAKVDKEKNKHLRKAAKGINFGLAYGMGAQGLAAIIGDDSKSDDENLTEAQAMLDQYFKSYPDIKKFLDNSAEEGVKMGYSRTMGGRKRYYNLPPKLDPNQFDSDEDIIEARRQVRRQKSAIERKAKNTPIQGTNADMIKLALIWIRNEIKKRKLDAKLVNTVHDEIVVECAEEIAENVCKLVEEEMERAGQVFIKSVPVVVDAAIEDYWMK